MNRNLRIVSFFVVMFTVLGGCSRKPSAEQSGKSKVTLQRLLGKAQLLPKSLGGPDAALSPGDSYVYLWEGTHRYRLFMKSAADVAQGREYVVDGIHAQKMIDEIGDPDQGRNGYPLSASCERVVRAAWGEQAFDAVDAQAGLLRAAVKRYPARPVFLVARIRPATPAESSAAAEERKKTAGPEGEDLPEISVGAEEQRASLLEGPTTLPAPLWEPQGGTVRCKVIINSEGKVADLESGSQLCEAVSWQQFRYKPPVQRGKPVRVKTEVEVRYEARK